MENPQHLIIHVGTNDIATNKQTEQIHKSIVEIAFSVKKQILYCDVTKPNSPKRWSSTKSCSDKPALERTIQRKQNVFDTTR